MLPTNDANDGKQQANTERAATKDLQNTSGSYRDHHLWRFYAGSASCTVWQPDGRGLLFTILKNSLCVDPLAMDPFMISGTVTNHRLN